MNLQLNIKCETNNLGKLDSSGQYLALHLLQLVAALLWVTRPNAVVVCHLHHAAHDRQSRQITKCQKL